MDAVKATLIYAELGNQEEAQWTCGRCNGISHAVRPDSVSNHAMSGPAWVKVMCKGCGAVLRIDIEPILGGFGVIGWEEINTDPKETRRV